MEIQSSGTLEKKGEKAANYKPGKRTLIRNETDRILILDCPHSNKKGRKRQTQRIITSFKPFEFAVSASYDLQMLIKTLG